MRPIHIDQVMRIQEQSLDVLQLRRGGRWIGGEDGGEFEEVEEDGFCDLSQVVGMAAGG